MPLDEYMKVVDAAEQLSVTPRQVRKLIERGTLRAEQLSARLYLVERASVEQYERTRRAPGRPSAHSPAKYAYTPKDRP